MSLESTAQQSKGRVVRDSSIDIPHWTSFTDPTRPITTSWQDSNHIAVKGMTQLKAYIYAVLGAADWLEFKFQYSFDGTSFMDRDGSGTIIKRITTATYNKCLSIPILDNYIRISARGFGAGGFDTTILAVDAIAGDSSFADDLGGDIAVTVEDIHQSTPTELNGTVFQPDETYLRGSVGPLIDAVAHIVDSGTPSANNMGADITAPMTDLSHHWRGSLQIALVNTDAVGNIYFQVGNNGVDFQNISVKDEAGNVYSSIPVTAAASWAHGIILDEYFLSFRYFILFYDRTSGNGKLDAWLNLH
jgi:hypothetical protein